MTLFVILGVVAVASIGWVLTRPKPAQEPTAANNWTNEDFAARRAVGSWTEGATYVKSEPGDSSGLGIE